MAFRLGIHPGPSLSHGVCVQTYMLYVHKLQGDTQDTLEARRPHWCVHTLTPHRPTMPHASICSLSHSSIHSSHFKGCPEKRLPRTQ